MIKKLWHGLLYWVINLISVKNDLGYIQKTTPVEVNKVKTMSNPIGDKENNMEINAISLFNHMTDEDFIAIHEAGQLKKLCLALSLDLQPKNYEEYNPYSA